MAARDCTRRATPRSWHGSVRSFSNDSAVRSCRQQPLTIGSTISGARRAGRTIRLTGSSPTFSRLPFASLWTKRLVTRQPSGKSSRKSIHSGGSATEQRQFFVSGRHETRDACRHSTGLHARKLWPMERRPTRLRGAVVHGPRARGIRENRGVRWRSCGVRARPAAARVTPRLRNR